MKYEIKYLKLEVFWKKIINGIQILKYFNKWVDGLTNEPFVNANMLELKYTGWMSNEEDKTLLVI